MMEYDIHTFLDLLTLLATLLVIYMLRFPLRDSYQAAEDSIQSYVVVHAHTPLSQHSAAMQLKHAFPWHLCLLLTVLLIAYTKPLPAMQHTSSSLPDRTIHHSTLSPGSAVTVPCLHVITA